MFGESARMAGGWGVSGRDGENWDSWSVMVRRLTGMWTAFSAAVRRFEVARSAARSGSLFRESDRMAAGWGMSDSDGGTVNPCPKMVCGLSGMCNVISIVEHRFKAARPAAQSGSMSGELARIAGGSDISGEGGENVVTWSVLVRRSAGAWVVISAVVHRSKVAGVAVQSDGVSEELVRMVAEGSRMSQGDEESIWA